MLLLSVITGQHPKDAYWKEYCFGLTTESLIDEAIQFCWVGNDWKDLKASAVSPYWNLPLVPKAARLDYVCGTYGGRRRPSRFLCLFLKLLQIQPDEEWLGLWFEMVCVFCVFVEAQVTWAKKDMLYGKRRFDWPNTVEVETLWRLRPFVHFFLTWQEVVLEYIKQPELKYLRALGCAYLRITARRRIGELSFWRLECLTDRQVYFNLYTRHRHSWSLCLLVCLSVCLSIYLWLSMHSTFGCVDLLTQECPSFIQTWHWSRSWLFRIS